MKSTTLHSTITAVVLLLLTSSVASAQYDYREQRRQQREAQRQQIAPTMERSRSVPRSEPRWEQGGPQIRAATTQDLINWQYQRNLQQNPNPPGYPARAWEILQSDRAAIRFGGKLRPSRRQTLRNIFYLGGQILGRFGQRCSRLRG